MPIVPSKYNNQTFNNVLLDKLFNFIIANNFPNNFYSILILLNIKHNNY